MMYISRKDRNRNRDRDGYIQGEGDIPLLQMDDYEEELSPCLMKLYKFFNWFSLLISTYLVSNSILLKFKYLDYIELDDRILYPLFGIGVLYMICSLPSLYCCLKRVCMNSYCLYLMYASIVLEVGYGIILYMKKPELFENLGLKIFLLSLGSFHLIYLIFLTALKNWRC